MTITPTAPSVTPCPVTWCPCAGHHKWSRLNLSSDPERWHTVTMLEFVDDDGAAHPQVTAECYETATGHVQTTVDLFTGYVQLLNRGEVTELVDAIKRAADFAFGPAEGLNNPETPAAERAVLHAVQEMAAGRAGQNAVIEEWERLQVARTIERADMDEFEAATAELVERASNPTDVNRLVAAAIRFRNAAVAAQATV